jgi:hypothetical protein
MNPNGQARHARKCIAHARFCSRIPTKTQGNLWQMYTKAPGERSASDKSLNHPRIDLANHLSTLSVIPVPRSDHFNSDVTPNFLIHRRATKHTDRLCALKPRDARIPTHFVSSPRHLKDLHKSTEDSTVTAAF